MKVTNFRSSSYNNFDFCQMQYFFYYCLNYRSTSNLKAAKGTLTHKALEILATKKFNEQLGNKKYWDDELNKEFIVSKITPYTAIEDAWQFYTIDKPTGHIWKNDDFKDCTEWMLKLINFNDGQFNPLLLDIIAPEKFFDLEINKPWAIYNYPDGEKGKLRIRGTVDLVTKIDNKALHLIDFKTGKRLDWATGKEKTYLDFYKDAQLLLYHYALRRIFPEYNQVVITIFYINDGGPFTLCFEDEHLKDFEIILQRRFTKVLNTIKPKRIWGSWKCSKLCEFYKNDTNGKSICENVYKEILDLGIDRVTKNRQQKGSYQGGGKVVNV